MLKGCKIKPLIYSKGLFLSPSTLKASSHCCDWCHNCLAWHWCVLVSEIQYLCSRKDVGRMLVFYVVITWKVNRKLKSWKKKILQQRDEGYETTLLQVRMYRHTGCYVPAFAFGNAFTFHRFAALTFLAGTPRISPDCFKRTKLPGNDSICFQSSAHL